MAWRMSPKQMVGYVVFGRNKSSAYMRAVVLLVVLGIVGTGCSDNTPVAACGDDYPVRPDAALAADCRVYCGKDTVSCSVDFDAGARAIVWCHMPPCHL